MFPPITPTHSVAPRLALVFRAPGTHVSVLPCPLICLSFLSPTPILLLVLCFHPSPIPTRLPHFSFSLPLPFFRDQHFASSTAVPPPPFSSDPLLPFPFLPLVGTNHHCLQLICSLRLGHGVGWLLQKALVGGREDLVAGAGLSLSPGHPTQHGLLWTGRVPDFNMLQDLHHLQLGPFIEAAP